MILQTNNIEGRDDRRESKRIEFIQYTYFKSEGIFEIRECWLNNISSGGISIYINCELAEGNEIVVLYNVGAKIRKDRVIVKHINKILNNWQCGCAFLESDDDRKLIIENILK